MLQTPPRRPLGPRTPTLAGRPHDFWRPLGEQDKPWLLRGQDHGTQVVLLGQHERARHHPGAPERHRRPPALDHPLPQRRFLRTPHTGRGARPRTPRPRQARTAARASTASSTHLERRAVRGGIVELSDAIARWWVLDDDHRARRREAGTWASTGHAAAVHGDELYDLLPQTRGGYGRLQDFGIRFGYERVVTPPPAPGRHRPPPVQHRPHAAAPRPRAAPVGPLGRGVRRRNARRDPPAPGTRRQRRRRPAPGRDPQPHQRDHAALPTQPLPANPTAHGNHPPSHPASAPAMSPPAGRRPGPKRTAPRRPQNRRTAPCRRRARPTTVGRRAARRRPR